MEYDSILANCLDAFWAAAEAGLGPTVDALADMTEAVARVGGRDLGDRHVQVVAGIELLATDGPAATMALARAWVAYLERELGYAPSETGPAEVA